MAYAALVVLAKELEQILPHHGAYIHLYGKETIETFHSNLIFIQKLFQDFPQNSCLMIKQLESRITGVANDARDIISRGISKRTYQNILKRCMEAVNSIAEDASEIRKILEIKNIHRRGSWKNSPLAGTTSRGKDTKVGLDMDLIQIKERIFERKSTLQIIPIVGMGGIGKSTLARNIYEDPQTLAYFDARFWVTFSQEYDTENMLKEILGDTGKKGDEPLIVSVHKKLSGRRFLIVMDDIWNVAAWEKVRNAFPDDNKGSRIILTTRLLDVATKVAFGSPLHEMQNLNEDQSWELFEKEAFGQHGCPLILKRQAKIISKKCKGLPLAIVVIARLLKLDQGEESWYNIARYMDETMSKNHDDQLMETLSLSYDNLPHHLKACFLYTSMFPEDYEIPSQKLIRLWVAEGFLKPATGKTMEEVAQKCLMDLVERNLISVGEKRSNGRIKTCTVHDIMRDLSLRKAKEEKFSQQMMPQVTNETSFTDKVFQRCLPWWFNDTSANSHQICPRRVGVTLPDLRSYRNDNYNENYNYGYVYSYLIHTFVDFDYVPRTMRFNLLRVLDILEIPFKPVIENGLINLRYLSFTYCGHADTTIRKFTNLETLIVKIDYQRLDMFFCILEMPKLRHFVMIYKTRTEETNYHLKRVGIRLNLQTLSGMNNLEFAMDTVEIFSNLVKLKAEYLDVKPADWDRLCLKNLVHLRRLENLTLMFNDYCSKTRVPLLPTNIVFPDQLKKLTLKGSIISWENMSAIGSLPNLEVLKLIGCLFESVEWEPVEGEFQLLKYLKLEVGNFEEWRVESNHFPCLEQLILRACYDLKDLPMELGEIESLQKLLIRHCEDSVGDSARKIQEMQQSYDNYQLQVLVLNPRKWH